MKTLSILAAAAVFGVAGVAAAAEPVKLSDADLDSVSAGFARNGFALATTFDGFSFGRTGSLIATSESKVEATESINNNVASSSIWASAQATGTAIGSGPGETGVSLGGGVLVGLFN